MHEEKQIIKNSEEIYKKKSQWVAVWKRLIKNKTAVAGLVILTIVIIIALCADLIADYNKVVIKQNYLDRLLPPNNDYWFGTDAFGRDVFARVIHGTRTSLIIGFSVTIIGVSIGIILGSVAAYSGGKIDTFIMRILDMFMGIPEILMAIAIIATIGSSLRNLIIAMSISRIPGFARIIRSSVLTVVDHEYVEAAKACGTSDGRIIMKHILPNAIGPIIVQATMSVAKVIINAAGLSFIGMGVQPPRPEWGSMLAEGREYMRNSMYLVVFPGISIILTALSLNLFGDGLRDALDPRLKN